MAAPLDRLASFIIDHLIVLSPVIFIFCAPFEKQLKEALLIGNEIQALAAGATLALMTVSILIIYHTVFTHIVGATIGQLVMGLRTQRVWDKKNLGLWNATLRSVVWLTNVMFLGIPTLAVFSDSNRRTWYDRLSDSVVVTIRPRRSLMGPPLYHRSMVQGFFAALFLFMFFIGGNLVISNIRDYSYTNRLIELLEEENVFCRMVGEAQEDWPKEEGKEPNRVNVALGLYFSGDLGIGCLEAEFDSRGFANQEDSTARLAKALIYSDHAELSDLYLNSVCDLEKTGAACLVSQSMLSLEDGDQARFREKLLSVGDQAPVYAKLWAVNELLDLQDYQGAQELLVNIPKLEYLSEALVAAETKLLFGLNGEASSSGAAQVAYTLLSDDKKAELSSWLCYEELNKSCNYWDSVSCEQLNSMAKDDSEILASNLASMAYLRKKECEDPEGVNYLGLMASGVTKDVKKLVKAKLSESVNDFRELAFNPKLNSKIRVSALTELLKYSKEPEDFLRVQVHWMKQSYSPSLNKVGQALMSYFMENRDYEAAVGVAEKIYESGPRMDRETLENYIVSEYNLGRQLKAKQILQVYKKNHPLEWINASEEPSEMDRTPASNNEFSMVVRSLK